MKKLVLPLGLLVMALVLGAAVAIDCMRLASDARHRVQLADDEMKKHEERLVKLLSGNSKVSPMVEAEVVTYEHADNRNNRHLYFDEVVASVRKATPSIDPTNPLERKFMDDIAGAINRREIAEKQYDEESTAYQKFLGSWQGKMARVFSSQARADSK
jgi:hypothetical protein